MTEQAADWTAQEIDILKKMQAAGFAAAAIARKLGKSRSAVQGKVSRLALSLAMIPVRHSQPIKAGAQPLTSTAVPFLHTRHGQCRAVLDQKQKGAVMVCGAPVLAHTSWCPDHYTQFFVPKEIDKPTDKETTNGQARIHVQSVRSASRR